MRVQWRGRTRGDETFWSDCRDALDVLSWLWDLYVRCVCVCACECAWVQGRTSKGSHRRLCQGWVITVVFSAPGGGSDGRDGWLDVRTRSSCRSTGSCLEVWARGWGRVVGGYWFGVLIKQYLLFILQLWNRITRNQGGKVYIISDNDFVHRPFSRFLFANKLIITYLCHRLIKLFKLLTQVSNSGPQTHFI